MLSSLLMLGSTNRKMKKINYLCALVWVAYMLSNANMKEGIIFTAVNIGVFLVTFALGQLVKGKYSNTIISVGSILIWSVLIDIVCFYMYPQFVIGQTIFGYIGNGLAFNAKYVFVNIFALAIAHVLGFVANRIKLEASISANKTVDEK